MKEELEAVEKYMDLIVEFAVKYGFQVVYAIIILIIGLIIARWLSNMVVRVCESRHLDITLSRFLGNVVRLTLIAFVLIIVLGKFGITMTPFIAAIGAVAFGSSLALAGLLSNYGAGLSIIITRPFVVNDTIQIQGVSGVVEEVGLAATRLSTEDGEQITIPNKHIVGEILINSFENKVVEASIGISYDDDAQKAIDTIQKALQTIPDIVSEPTPQIGIEEFADSSVNIGIRYWVPTKQYFQTLYQANLAVYKALDQAGITIPFPQRDIHMAAGDQG
ncbi:MAG: mechanosensitive ion channel family protein [Desulfobacterales bacterium]|nr:mechanosensitive ion channel family protein [Desulfobacterales bacterium]